MALLTIITFLLWSYQLLFVSINLNAWKAIRSKESLRHPLVSVLIPARNEAEHLDTLLASLQAQSYTHLEVIVYDDQSTDATAQKLHAWQEKFAELTVLQGKPLPPSWLGKPHACHQLALHARGDWLLFLDADTQLQNTAIHSLIATVNNENVAMLSGFGHVTSPSLFSGLLTSMMAFVIAMHLPISMIRHNRDPRFVAANGALILIERSSYDRAGGHEAVKSELVEDMAIAKRVKTQGDTVLLCDLCDQLTIQMYDTFAQAWRGYQKNIFPGLGRSYFMASLVILWYLILYALPWLVLLLALLTPTLGYLRALPIATVGIMLLTKRLVDHKFKVRRIVSLGAPLSGLLLVLLLVSSLWRHRSGQGYAWKGRTYP